MYFAEYTATAVGERVSDIVINDVTLEADVDVFALAGGQNRALSLAMDFYTGSSEFFNISFPTKVPAPSGKTPRSASAVWRHQS